MSENFRIINADVGIALETLEAESVDCIITSPPYWALRDYGVDGQLGVEATYGEYIWKLCNIMDQCKRVLKITGTLFLNLGDTYGGTGDKGNYRDPMYAEGRNGQKKSLNKSAPEKCLLQIPSRVAIEMCNRGWILRNEIIWHKPNAMPSSAEDRFSVDFEKVYFFSKCKSYHFNQILEKSLWAEKDSRFLNGPSSGGKATSGEYAINKGGAFRSDGMRNKRAVWTIPTQPYDGAHFATFPKTLVEPMVLAGCPRGGVVMDPFTGSGTTGEVALENGREFLGIEINPAYHALAVERLTHAQRPLL